MLAPVRLKEALSLGGLKVPELAVRTWHQMNQHEIFTRAAAISFYAMLAFIPFLAFVITLVAQLLPDPSDRSGQEVGVGNLTVTELRATLKSLFPADAYELVEEQITRLQRQPPVGILSVGLAIMLWTAASLFLAVIDSMNRIYGVAETRPFWKLRLVAMLMTIVQAAILIGSLLAIVAGPQVFAWLHLSAQSALLAELVQLLVLVVMVLLSFALTFYVGPDADQRWEWITPGSVAGTVVFLGVGYLFRVYIQNFAHYDKTYGPLAGVMVLLLWFWISSVILLTAGQMNKVIEDASPLGKRYGQKVDPSCRPEYPSRPAASPGRS